MKTNNLKCEIIVRPSKNAFSDDVSPHLWFRYIAIANDGTEFEYSRSEKKWKLKPYYSQD